MSLLNNFRKHNNEYSEIFSEKFYSGKKNQKDIHGRISCGVNSYLIEKC